MGSRSHGRLDYLESCDRPHKAIDDACARRSTAAGEFKEWICISTSLSPVRTGSANTVPARAHGAVLRADALAGGRIKRTRRRPAASDRRREILDGFRRLPTDPSHVIAVRRRD